LSPERVANVAFIIRSNAVRAIRAVMY